MVTSLLVQAILKEDADSESWLVPKTHSQDYQSLGEWTVKVPCLCVLFVVLQTEHWTSCMVCKLSVTELCSQPSYHVIFCNRILLNCRA